MSKLEEKILNSIKNKKEIVVKNKNTNIYSLISIVWMFLIPIFFAGAICFLFIDNTKIASIIMAIGALSGIYNVIKIILNVYRDKE